MTLSTRDLERLGIAPAYYHCAAQLRSRYRLRMGPQLYMDLCEQISRSLPELEVVPAGPGRVQVRWRTQGRMVRFVFDAQYCLLITALPPYETPRHRGDMLTPNGHRRKAPDQRRHRDNRRKYPQMWEED